MKATIKAAAGMNLRAGPGTEHELVGNAKPGSWFTVTRQVGEWVEIGAGWLYAGDPTWVALEGDEQPEPVLLSGVDVSDHQGQIDWRLMAERGVQVAGIKVTEGTGHVQTWWRENHKWARAYGIQVFPYHYYRNNMPAIEQARHYRNQYSMVDWDYPPAGDFEDNTPGQSAASLGSDIRRFLQESASSVVYTAAWWWNPNVGGVAWASDYRLWVASWRNDAPIMPAGWSEWWGWQWRVTDNAAAWGAESARLDLDWFRPPACLNCRV